MDCSEPPDEQLESVLGATPHEFESRILRRSEAPPGSPVRGFCVPDPNRALKGIPAIEITKPRLLISMAV
jgi:hypothetical protein